MRYGLDVSIAGTYADPRTLAELAHEAEQAGWEGFFIWDVLFAPEPADAPVTDPWVALAAIAVATRRIRIGALVTPLARYHPWQVARATVALDHLSRGRLIFGIGLGYQARDFAAFGQTVDPAIRAQRADEGLEIVTGLWSGRPFSFAGKHYAVREATFLPRPLQVPRIPVWVAAYWPYHGPLRRAARWDGLLPGKVNDEDLHPDELRDMLVYVRAHRGTSAPFDVAVYGRTPARREEAREMVEPWIAAGATWWRENIEDERGPLEAMRERIRYGPPRVP
jgi:hypothetical protein